MGLTSKEDSERSQPDYLPPSLSGTRVASNEEIRAPAAGKFGDWEILEARGGIEPPLRVLQTLALPLGHRAL
jgi:hypothetical protein